MRAGLQVWNTDGVLLIDSSQMSMGLSKSGYITSETIFESGYRAYKQVAVQVYGSNPIVFFGVSPWQIGLRKVSRSGRAWTFYYAVGQTIAPSLKIPYYVFDFMTPAGRVGLETYDETGRLTFTSGRAPMRVLRAVRLPRPSFSGGLFEAYQGSGGFNPQLQALGYPASSYAGNLSFPRLGFQASQTQVSTVDNTFETLRVFGTGFVAEFVRTGYTDYGAAPWGDFVYCQNPPTVTLIDVANVPIPFG